MRDAYCALRGLKHIMLALNLHKHFQDVRYLPFCYLCGLDFKSDDDVDGDHVPPKSVFNASDRKLVLKLKTHKNCNSAYKVDDKKVAQLIGLRLGRAPSSERDISLKFAHYPGLGVGVKNLNVDAAIWRWIKAFHAALYRQPLHGNNFAIQTPFPRADLNLGKFQIQPLRAQHFLAVEEIKRNRILRNIDSVVAYNRKLRYECIWCQADDRASWFCMFGLDIYDWKDLGSSSRDIPARGCAGVYALPDRAAPSNAAINRSGRIIIPNLDPFDPFAR